MMLRLSKKIYAHWGAEAGDMFSFLSEVLQARGFRGPLAWNEVAMATFAIDVTEKIRIILTISSAGGNLTETFFDSALIILSKCLAENTLSSEPWWDAPQGDFEGYLRCMVLHLSHMKWAATPSSANPAWVSSRAGAEHWLADFDAFFGPVIGQLRSDYDLAKLMWDAIHYERPAWVLSDAPASAMFFKERFMALQR